MAVGVHPLLATQQHTQFTKHRFVIYLQLLCCFRFNLPSTMSGNEVPRRAIDMLNELVRSTTNQTVTRKLEAIVRQLSNEDDESANAKRELRKSQEKVRELRRKRSSLAKGGKGKNAMLKTGETDTPLLGVIKEKIETKLFIPMTAMPPDGWLTYDERDESWCMHILRLLGYTGENAKDLPADCEDLEDLWTIIIGALNLKRQQFNSAMVKRMDTKMHSKYLFTTRGSWQSQH